MERFIIKILIILFHLFTIFCYLFIILFKNYFYILMILKAILMFILIDFIA
jgi:hypothetical protein